MQLTCYQSVDFLAYYYYYYYYVCSFSNTKQDLILTSSLLAYDSHTHTC